jgi:high-affinity iron transporter
VVKNILVGGLMRKTTWTLLILCISFLLLPITAFAKDAENDLLLANEHVTEAVSFAEKEDYKSSEEQFKLFRSTWFEIEAGIKKKSVDAYRGIEVTLGEIQYAFLQQPVNKAAITDTLNKLNQQNISFIQGDFKSFDADGTSVSSEKTTLAATISLLDQAISNIQQNNPQAAKENVQQFRKSWLDVEGIILTQSLKVYKSTESDMVISYSQLAANPPDTAGATITLTQMRDYLTPLSVKTSYTMVDAVTIILREGLEALLVIVALLGFLKKSGNRDKEKWIWSGVGAGVAVCLVLGIIIQVLFSSGAFGSNNFLISGITGIFAAIMLVYMSYWLHSKTSLAQWSQYISNKSTKALASGSLWSLAVLSFLAIFREGTEMVLFFIGMASSISLYNLLSGVFIGIAILGLLSYLILKIGVKIPMRPFFLISSIFVFYLCFKFLGMGIHGLQLSGVLQATPINSMSMTEFFAIYPTWETIIPQAALLLFAICIVIWSKRKDIKIREQLQIQQNTN